MRVISGMGVNDVYAQGMNIIERVGQKMPSRNGETIEFPEPVTTVYLAPEQRVLFDEKRDANPFFHLHEALWMLDGRDDVMGLSSFNGQIEKYSDNGETFNGAYGHRWRNHFGFDQIQNIIRLLRETPDTRRAVLQMWDPNNDLIDQKSLDLPCNTACFFKIRNGNLQMMVTNRSNDMIWGAYGANAVHFSMLQEYIAGCVGVGVGTYRQVSDSLHVYADVYRKVRRDAYPDNDPYADGLVSVYQLVEHPCDFQDDLRTYMMDADDWHDDLPARLYSNPFFAQVACKMRDAYLLWKLKRDYQGAYNILGSMPRDNDWRVAGTLWLRRREENAKKGK